MPNPSKRTDCHFRSLLNRKIGQSRRWQLGGNPGLLHWSG